MHSAQTPFRSLLRGTVRPQWAHGVGSFSFSITFDSRWFVVCRQSGMVSRCAGCGHGWIIGWK